MGLNPIDGNILGGEHHTSSSETTMWFVRAGRNGIYAEYFLQANLVAIGWGEVGEITPSLPDDEISRRFSELWPREKPATRRTWSGQVKRFHREIEVEDTVVTYDPETRLYHLGDIQSSAEIRVRSVDDQDRHEFVRDVVWTGQCPRDGLSIGTRNTLGSSLTLFQVSGSAAEELLEYSSERLQL